MATTTPRRRVVIYSVGIAIGLIAVRGYVELLRQHYEFLAAWFSGHPVRSGLPVTAAILTSSLTALFVRRTHSRLVVPAAMLAGALTAAPYNSLIGTIVGGLIGTLFSSASLRRLLITSATLVVRHAVPTILLAGAAACLGRMITYSELPSGSTVGAALMVAAIPWAFWIGWRGSFPWKPPPALRSMPSSDTKIASHTPSWQLIIRVASVAMLVMFSLWVGWQSDIYRRVWLLNRVGGLFWQRAEPRQWLTHGPWIPYEAMLYRSAQDRQLRLLRGLPGLQSVILQNGRLGDASYRHLKALPKLSSLHLYNLPITDEGFRYVADLKGLSALYIENSHMSRRSLERLGTLPALEHVSIKGLSPAASVSLDGLSQASRIRWLRLQDCQIDDKDLAAIGRLAWLQYLSLPNNLIVGTQLAQLSKPPRLATLVLSDNPLDDRHLESLADTGISGLMIDGVILSEVGCRSLQRMRWLQVLSVRRSQISDAQLRQLTASLKLVDGNFDGTRLTARSFVGMFQRDVHVFVEDQQLQAEDIARLGDLGPDVQLVRCQLSPSAVAELANHPRLFSLQDCETQTRFELVLEKYAEVFRSR